MITKLNFSFEKSNISFKSFLIIISAIFLGEESLLPLKKAVFKTPSLSR